MQILGSRVRLSVAAVICPQRSHSGNLINPRQLNSFFFLWQNGRPNDVLGIHSILGIVVVFLCLSFFSFSFRDAEVLWARLRVVKWSVRRIWMEEEGRHLSFHFFFNFFFSRPPSPQSRPGLLTPPPRFVVSSHFASASAFAFPSPSSSSRSPCLSSSLSTNRLRLNLRLSLYPRARPTKHLLVMF